MTQNPFQPWKQNFSLPSQFYRKNDTDILTTISKVKNGDAASSGSSTSVQSRQFELGSDSPSYHIPVTSSSNNLGPQIDSDQPTNKPSQNGAKFSIFSQLLNLNKINAFDNLLLNASMSLEDEELSSDKRHGIKKLMEQAISDDAKQQIAFILEKISALRPAEKLLLYLKMPGGHSEVDPLKQSQNPLGSRLEISHTINWVRSHLEHDEKVSIPKQEVYEDYVSFCGKINIKPLSTADFGKVMKQVFPDIRPRRLGTRGHSRYCYAAMRKASKLQPPQLPCISSRNDSLALHTKNEEGAWNVIKAWSESLLNVQFESVDDLASHISQNKSSPSTSKQILQRKIMQREAKDRKRTNNEPSKKKRRKRRKTSASPESFQSNDELMGGQIRIKQEKETDGSAVENNYSDDSSDLPMNLTNTDQARRSENESSTSAATVTSQFCNEADESFVNKLKFIAKVNLPQANDEEENDFPLCKKVRQAQLVKLTSQSNQFADNSMIDSNTSAIGGSEIIHEMLMPSKIPLKRKQRKDANGPIKKSKHFDKKDSDDVAGTSALNQVESNEFGGRKDELKEEFIIPRERFISICNMDRNALDTYLNSNEENSQDLELLQYFGEDKNKSAEYVQEDLGPASTSVPLLENYQLVSEAKNGDRNSDKISQLRSMLEEKYNNTYSSNPGNESIIKNLLQKNGSQSSLDATCESLTGYSNMNILSPQQQTIRSFETEMAMKSSSVPQSPNTRRKNFSFVPIPNQSSTKIKNVNLHPAFKNEAMNSPFVSPRATPVSRHVNTFLNIRNPMESKSIPMLGVNNTAFSRPQHFKMEPQSAPQSPLMAQNYNYSNSQTQQNHFQFQTINNQGTNFNFPVESRSQSVPPHCTNNNMFNSYNSYSSACSSMAPTPVPSDYQEFSDTHILDIFNNEQSQPSSSIKLEASDDVINLLDNEIMNQSSEESQATRQIYLNSRSVPNTPLPYHSSYGNVNSFCPIGKSVPTTPISNGNNPFCYSPELQRKRDFLINGFNNNNNNNVLNNNNKMMNDKNGDFHGEEEDESLVNDIDELSNLDTSLLNNL